jgi:hypothetical protein
VIDAEVVCSDDEEVKAGILDEAAASWFFSLSHEVCGNYGEGGEALNGSFHRLHTTWSTSTTHSTRWGP